jgi:glycosyltransferase involved in cell wall biosynthesis
MVNPRITVLMPVYNAECFLEEAIASILSQTFEDFEFVIIDDGSSDASASIIRSFGDHRIRFFQNEENQGISSTLNKGIDLASCDLIARMDADDVSDRFRLQKQYAYMRDHPACGLLSAWARVVTPENRFVRMERYRSKHYYYNLTFECWIYHPTVMFRRRAVVSVGKYSMPYSEDYDLFWKLSRKFEIGNLAEPLVTYRLSPASLNLVLRKKEYEIANEQNVLRNIRYYMGDHFFISRECLECLRHNFHPIVTKNSIANVLGALALLAGITEKILHEENPNRDQESIMEAYHFKREFIITQLANRMPVMKKLLLVLRTGEWLLGYSLFMRFVKWQVKRLRMLLFSF